MMTWVLIAAPLLGAFVNGIVGRQWKGNAPGILACIAVFTSFLAALHFAVPILSGTGADLHPVLFQWMQVGSLSLPVQFNMDALCVCMLLLVTGVGFLIHVFAVPYMHDDPAVGRFFALLNLFIFFMLILVLGQNLPLLFVGWEGVGLCSYGLISFWFDDPAKAQAGKKAFIVNRIGDAGLLIGFFILFAVFNSLDIPTILHHIQVMDAQLPLGILTIATLCLVLGLCGKSAQFPLYVWLPDAMAGPTPVSALIHAATMVTSGIYLFCRLSTLIVLTPFTCCVLLMLGALTAFLAAVIATAQTDIKKVLAYSTVSQLGYMVMALGVGAFIPAFFHVLTHAFFKALLFLGAGAVIYNLHHEQNMEHMGGLFKKMPIVAVTMGLATLAIAGIPPFAGFFSKDAILLAVFSNELMLVPRALSMFVFGMAVLTALMTAYYMGRLYFMTFLGSYRGHHEVHHTPRSMSVVLVILAVGAVFGGLLNLPEWTGTEGTLSRLLGPSMSYFAGHPAEVSARGEWMLMGISVFAALLGLWIAYRRVVLQHHVHVDAGQASVRWRLEALYLDRFYDVFLIKPLWAFALLLKFLDQFLIDGAIAFVALSARMLGSLMEALQNRRVKDGTAMIAAGAMAALVALLLLSK